MDPISTAIITALTVGATSGITDISKKIIIDSYIGLKSLLSRKCSDQEELLDSLERLEQKPDAAGRRQAFAAEVATSKLNDDPDILALAQALTNALKKLPEGEQHIQIVKGSFNAIADHGSTATVNVSGLAVDKNA